MKNTKISLDLMIRMGQYQNTFMGLQVWANDDRVLSRPAGTGLATSERLEIQTQVPLVLKIQVDGKHRDDTMVGESGEILEDKCVVVEGLAVDGIWLKKWYLESRAFDFRDHQGLCRSTNYFGTNGEATFRITTLDLLDFWLETMCVDN